MAIRWEALTIDTHDPASLARWWAHTLDGELVDWSPVGVEVRPTRPPSPSLFFIPVPEDAEWIVMRDPEGNELCLLDPR